MSMPNETHPLNSNSKSVTVSKKLNYMLLLSFSSNLSLLTYYLSKVLRKIQQEVLEIHFEIYFEKILKM